MLTILEDELDFDIRIGRHKFRQNRGQPVGAEGNRRGDAQKALWFFPTVPKGRLGHGHFHGHISGGVEKNMPLFGQSQSARMTVEQGNFEILFQGRDLPRDRRLGDFESVGGGRQRPMLRRSVKCFELIPIEGVRHLFRRFLNGLSFVMLGEEAFCFESAHAA